MTEDKPLFYEAPVDFMAKKPKKPPKKPKQPTEAEVQAQVCRYLKLQYPNVIFASDLSGVRLPYGLANKVAPLKSGRAMPDMTIYKKKYGYGALAIELKRPGARVFYAKTHKPADDHIAEQIAVLELLRGEGYCAEMVRGFDNAKFLIDWYLMETPIETPAQYQRFQGIECVIGQPINGLNQLMR